MLEDKSRRTLRMLPHNVVEPVESTSMPTAKFIATLSATLILFQACSGGGDDGPAAPPNSGELRFSASAFVIREDGSPVIEIVVERVLGSDGIASVTIQLSDGTATGGTPPLVEPFDYDNSPIVVTFMDGDAAPKSVTVPVLDDTAIEPHESVNLVMTKPHGATIGSPSSAVLTIENNDSVGVFGFAQPVAIYGENSADLMPLVVRRSAGSTGSVTVTVTFSSGTAEVGSLPGATEPADLQATSHVVTFLDQDVTEKTIPASALAIISDPRPELDETFFAAITSVSVGLIDPAASATVTLRDDDTIWTLSPSGPPAPTGRFGAALARAGVRLAVGVPGATLFSIANFGAVAVLDANSGTVVDAVFNPMLNDGRFGSTLANRESDLCIGVPQAPGSLGFVVVVDGPTLGVRHFLLPAPLECGGAHNCGTSLAAGPDVIIAGGPTSCVSSNVPYGGVFAFDPLSGAVSPTWAGSLPGERFGQTVAVLDDGRVVVGAPLSPMFQVLTEVGVVRVYSNRGALDLVLNNPFPAMGDHFGMAIGVLGNTIAVGAPDDDTLGSDVGMVYLFNATNGDYIGSLLPPLPAMIGGKFGAEIKTIRGRFAVQQERAGANNSGVVHVFSESGGILQSIVCPEPTANADFGASMFEFDGQLAIGAPETASPPMQSVGRVHIVKVD